MYEPCLSLLFCSPRSKGQSCFSQIAALQLIESGRLDIETPVADFLPQLKDPLIVEDDVSIPPKVVGPAKTTIRVRHLLDFTSGIYGFKSPTAGIALNPVYTSAYPMEDKYTAYFDMLKVLNLNWLDTVSFDEPLLLGSTFGSASAIRTWYRLYVNPKSIALISLTVHPVTYGHSSDVLGFIVEIITGDTLDAYM